MKLSAFFQAKNVKNKEKKNLPSIWLQFWPKAWRFFSLNGLSATAVQLARSLALSPSLFSIRLRSTRQIASRFRFSVSFNFQFSRIFSYEIALRLIECNSERIPAHKLSIYLPGLCCIWRMLSEFLGKLHKLMADLPAKTDFNSVSKLTISSRKQTRKGA